MSLLPRHRRTDQAEAEAGRGATDPSAAGAGSDELSRSDDLEQGIKETPRELEANLSDDEAKFGEVRHERVLEGERGTAEAHARMPASASGGKHDGGGGHGRPLTENVSADGRRDSAPSGTDPSTTTFATIKRTGKEFMEDGLTDWAASLTYYGLLAIFPGLIALVGILGIFGDPQTTTRALTDIVMDLAPGSAADTFAGPIESITSDKGTAGVMVFVGIATALWSASSYVGAFMRASNVIYETPEGRPFWKLRPLQLLVTLVMVLLLVAVVIALVMTGPVVEAVAGPLGLGDTAVTVWNIAKWPVLVFVVLVMLGVLYYASPNVKLPKFSLITPGAMLALGVWVVASVLFAFYVANFGSYDATYGTLGGVISLLVWLWISNIALLLGAQLNAEIERTRELKAGVTDAAYEIQLDARVEPDEPKTT